MHLDFGEYPELDAKSPMAILHYFYSAFADEVESDMHRATSRAA